MEEAHSFTESLSTLRSSNLTNMFENSDYLFNRFDKSHRVVIDSKFVLNGFFRVVNIVSIYKLPNFIKSMFHHEIIRHSFSLMLPDIKKFCPVISEICSDGSEYLRKTNIRIYSFLNCSRKSLSLGLTQFIEISVKRKRNRRFSHNLLSIVKVEVIPAFLKTEIMDEIALFRVGIVLGS